MYPTELLRNQPTAQQMWLILHLDPALFWFKGHFDVQPLLPGVAQIDWALHYGQALLRVEEGAAWQFGGIERVKFQQPLLPDNRVLLMLDWDAVRGMLEFSYQRTDAHGTVNGPIASQGKITLCR